MSVDLPSDALGASVVLRLLDEGIDVLPKGAAGVHQLEVGGEGRTRWVRVIAPGASEGPRLQVEASAAQVANLELLQRATMAIEAAGPLANVDTPLVWLGEGPAEVRGRVALSVLENGYGVAANEAAAAITLCIALRTDGIVLGASSERNSTCKATNEVRGALAETVRAVLNPAPKHQSAPWRVTVRAAGGVVGRVSAADGAVTAGADVSRGWLLARVDAVFVPASQGVVRAFETQLFLGAGARLELTQWLTFRSGARAGFRVHRYDVEGESAAGVSGNRIDFSADFPLGLSFDLWEGLRLELEVIAGLDARSRRHTRGDEELWYRGRFRLMGALGLGYEILF